MGDDFHIFPAPTGNVGCGDGEIGSFSYPQWPWPKPLQGGCWYHCEPSGMTIRKYKQQICTHASHHAPLMAYFADDGRGQAEQRGWSIDGIEDTKAYQTQALPVKAALQKL